jgi:hypothetical protein
MNLQETDTVQLLERNISPSNFIDQIKSILEKIRPTKIEKPCIPGDGIECLSPIECNHYVQVFEKNTQHTKALFIPASGAATRMFKHLSVVESFEMDQLSEEFIVHFTSFPFFPSLKRKFSELGFQIEEMIRQDDWRNIIRIMCYDISFTELPKALIPFHCYTSGETTALLDQVREGLAYAKNHNQNTVFHFTISSEIKNLFEIEKAVILNHFQQEQIDIHFSFQSSTTDTPALKNDGGLARDKSGKIIFRPAGHGALLENLSRISEDIIFVKNIDNIAHAKWEDEIIFYKRVLGGFLIEVVEKCHDLLKRIEQKEAIASEAAKDFLFQTFGYHFNEETNDGRLYDLLYRPIRVCGMVRNEGEPGGGPFWVLQSNGQIGKQIVEKNQIDVSDASQNNCLHNSTHFNPVDIVCCIKDHNGNKYNLKKYVDESTSFISDKFQEGQVVKALELPGLWNGSMAGWNTIFVEVPNSTFHPVKTVNDLLRPGHQE